MAVPCSKTRNFFLHGSSAQFEHVLDLYDQCLRLKAESKSQKPENVIRLDKWYQTELPKKIKSRGKDAYLTHEDLVQTIKWKLARGKFRPNLSNLVQMNTPRVVVQETKKGFRNLFKRNDLQAANSALCNLKGVGPAMASAVLAAGAPHIAPFMADECLLALPDIDSLDYTMKEYMRFVDHVNECVKRLNEEDGSDKWTPHKVELTVWSYYIANDLKPELLDDVPNANGTVASSTNESKKQDSVEEKNSEKSENGKEISEDSSESKEETQKAKDEKEEANHNGTTSSTENSNQSASDEASNDASAAEAEANTAENASPVESNANVNGDVSEKSPETDEITEKNGTNSTATATNGDSNKTIEKSQEIPAAEKEGEKRPLESGDDKEAQEPAAKKLKPEEEPQTVSMETSA